MKLTDFLNRLAEDLPQGYEVSINVENGSAWINIFDWSGNLYNFDLDTEISDEQLILDLLNHVSKIQEKTK